MARKPSANHTTAAATIEPPIALDVAGQQILEGAAAAKQFVADTEQSITDGIAERGTVPVHASEPLGDDDPGHLPPGWRDEPTEPAMAVTPVDQPPSYRIEKSEDWARVPDPWHVIDNWTNTVVSKHGTVTDARTDRDRRMKG